MANEFDYEFVIPVRMREPLDAGEIELIKKLLAKSSAPILVFVAPEDIRCNLVRSLTGSE